MVPNRIAQYSIRWRGARLGEEQPRGKQRIWSISVRNRRIHVRERFATTLDFWAGGLQWKSPKKKASMGRLPGDFPDGGPSLVLIAPGRP